MPRDRPSGPFQRWKSTTKPCRLKRPCRKGPGVSNRTFLKNTRHVTAPAAGAGGPRGPSSLLSGATPITRPSTSAPSSSSMAVAASEARANSTVPRPFERPSGLLNMMNSRTVPYCLNRLSRKRSGVSNSTFLKNTLREPECPLPSPLPPLPSPFQPLPMSRLGPGARPASRSSRCIGRPSTSTPSSSARASWASAAWPYSTVPSPRDRPSGARCRSSSRTRPCRLKMPIKKPGVVS
mmetsp:Transcript_12583/g.37395  ORF Transcript_12583/g.37395 Transcript_12583/m.37395 type:complete len:237 (-) Transcript_12583:471-1181(-)